MLKTVQVTPSPVLGLRPHASGPLQLAPRTSFSSGLRQPLGRCGACELSLCRSPASVHVASARAEVSGLEHGAGEPDKPPRQQLWSDLGSRLATWGLAIAASAMALWSGIKYLGWVDRASGLEHASCPFLGHCPHRCRPSFLRCAVVVQVLQILSGPVGVAAINSASYILLFFTIKVSVTACIEAAATAESVAKQREAVEKQLEYRKGYAARGAEESAEGAKFQGTDDEGVSCNTHSAEKKIAALEEQQDAFEARLAAVEVRQARLEDVDKLVHSIQAMDASLNVFQRFKIMMALYEKILRTP